MKKIIAKFALGAVLVMGAALVAAAPGSAAVRIGIGIGVPGYYGAPYYNYSCDPYSRFYDPYRCGYGYYGYPAYYGPSFYFGGGYYRGGYGGSYRGSAGVRSSGSFHGSTGGGHRR